MKPAPWLGVERCADAEHAVRATAALVQEVADRALLHRGAFHLALSGGTTARLLFPVLARTTLDWARITLWWGDERAVGPDHPESNYQSARTLLLEALPHPPRAVHRLLGEAADLPAAAAAYQHTLVAALGEPPVLDLVLLGLGRDGHTASWFPRSPALEALGDGAPWVMANPVDSPLTGGAATRLTLTPRTVLAARHLAVLACGRDKAAAVAVAVGGSDHVAQIPAQLLAGAAERVQWILDDDAAHDLRAPDPRR